MSTFTKKQIEKNNYKIAVVIAEFNPLISEQLRLGAIDAFYNYGGIKSNIQCFYVPGAFEIPGCVNQIMLNRQFDAIITLGAVIKGGTHILTLLQENQQTKFHFYQLRLIFLYYLEF